MPDGSAYAFSYEQTPGNGSAVTGRLHSVTLPSGGTITYSYTGGSNGINCADGTAAGLTRATPDGTWTYTRSGSSPAWTTTVSDPQGNQTVLNFQQIYETQRQVYQGSGTLLETAQTCYNGSAFPCTGTAITLPITRRTVQVTLPDGKTSTTDTTYDSNGYGLPVEVDEYDFGASTPTRKSLTTYAIYDEPAQVTVQDGAGNTIAQTNYAYDQSAVTATSAPQHISVTWQRGNLTNVQGFGVGAVLAKTLTYLDTGQIQSETDFNNNTTSYTYAGCGNMLSAVALPLSLTRSYTWDCNGGALTSVADENNQTTSYAYDSSWRRTQTSYPDGGQTTVTYNMNVLPQNIVTATALNANQSETSKLLLDPLGRPQQQQLTSDPEGTAYADSAYDSLGRVASVSNPYRSTSDPTYGTTYYAYDALGRVTTQTQPDGNTINTTYASECAISVDEAGKQRKVCRDGLGRIAAVFEPDNSNNLTWETDYSYDVLNDLTAVTQKGGSSDSTQWRTRAFTYDALGRLIQAVTPEGGTDKYSYSSGTSICSGDPAAVCSHTDARNISTTFSYDALNRLRNRSYSDGSPTVGYAYDQTSIWGLAPQNGKGRVTHEYNGNHAERVYSYDAMGRLVTQWECLPSNCGVSTYNTMVAYDLAGNLTQLTYPSGRVVAYTNSTAGRPTQVTFASAGGQGVNYNYASNIKYAPGGAFASLPLGNGLTESLSYNNRAQLTGMQVASTLLTAINRTVSYTDGAGHNNGNVVSVTDQLNSARTQAFAYDQLNRVASATESAWGLSFGYDPWGNFLQQNLTKGSAPTLNVTANGNNQTAGYSYDAGGNLVGDSSHTYQFDPENKLKSLDSTAATYAYDADGMRVVQTVASDTHEYIMSGGITLADHHGSDWTDYIYLGGWRIVKADSFEDRIHVHGTNCSSCGSQYTLFQFPNAAGYVGYVIRSGDELFLRQWQSSGAHGGMVVAFSDGTNTNWSVTDQDGNQLNNDGAQQTWHYRRVDLSQYAGKAISRIYLVQESTTAAGTWDIYFNDISLSSTDGTVRPIYNRETSISLSISGTSGVTGASYNIDHASNEVQYPDVTTTYYHTDHIGSARLMSSVNGYPVWQATYLPFGYEYNPQSGVNNFKFTDYQRDSESGLDYAKFRYYSSTIGRFMSPDPVSGDIANPQTWNRYAYVRNNPINSTDPLGLYLPVGRGQSWSLSDGCGASECAIDGGGGGGGGFNIDISGAAGGGFGLPNGGFGNGDMVTLPPQPLPQSIWQDALGLPSMNCPYSMGPWCNGQDLANPIMDAANTGTIRAGTLDQLNDYCSARGRAKFVADWLPGGATIARTLWGSHNGDQLGFYQLSTADLNNITGENSGGQTVAMHAASEGLKAAAGSTAFLSWFRGATGVPKTLASTWLGRLSIALIVADASSGFYKEGKEILNCQAGN